MTFEIVRENKHKGFFSIHTGRDIDSSFVCQSWVFNRDTMQICVKKNQLGLYAIINKVPFIKGRYNLDLNELFTKYGKQKIVIDEFPQVKRVIKIKKAYNDEGQLFFMKENDRVNVSKDKTLFNRKQIREYAYFGTSMIQTPDFSIFVCKGDTMKVRLHYNHYDVCAIEIESMHFKKGTFEFDLYAYIKNNEVKCLPIVIKDFPDDCMKYRIKTGMK